jgi:hypothetical protein
MALNLNQIKPFNLITNINLNLLNNNHNLYLNFLFYIINQVNFKFYKGRYIKFKLVKNKYNKLILLFNKKTKKGDFLMDLTINKILTLNDDVPEEKQFKNFLMVCVFGLKF